MCHWTANVVTVCFKKKKKGFPVESPLTAIVNECCLIQNVILDDG